MYIEIIIKLKQLLIRILFSTNKEHKIIFTFYIFKNLVTIFLLVKINDVLLYVTY